MASILTIVPSLALFQSSKASKIEPPDFQPDLERPDLRNVRPDLRNVRPDLQPKSGSKSGRTFLKSGRTFLKSGRTFLKSGCKSGSKSGGSIFEAFEV